MKLFLLSIATISTILFMVGLIKGKKYASYVESLDSFDYFLKNLYVVGLGLNDTKMFKLRGNVGRNLKKNAKLYYDNVYYEYYATVSWAQFLTFALMILSIGTSLCSFFSGDGMILMFGIVIIAILAVWNMSMSKVKEEIDKRRSECVQEFPNMVSKLSLLINSGMVLREAWKVVARGKEGTLYDLMKKSCEYMENGESDMDAIHKFGILSDAGEIKKFTGAMIQGIEKGNSELAEFMVTQSAELWAHKRQLALQQGEIAAGKLIIPLGMTFIGIIMIVVVASLQSMSF